MATATATEAEAAAARRTAAVTAAVAAAARQRLWGAWLAALWGLQVGARGVSLQLYRSVTAECSAVVLLVWLVWLLLVLVLGEYEYISGADAGDEVLRCLGSKCAALAAPGAAALPIAALPRCCFA